MHYLTVGLIVLIGTPILFWIFASVLIEVIYTFFAGRLPVHKEEVQYRILLLLSGMISIELYFYLNEYQKFDILISIILSGFGFGLMYTVLASTIMTKYQSGEKELAPIAEWPEMGKLYRSKIKVEEETLYGLQTVDKIFLPLKFRSISKIYGDHQTIECALESGEKYTIFPTRQIFKNAKKLDDSFYQVEENGLLGICKSDGTLIVSPMYKEISIYFSKDDFHIFKVKKDEFSSYIDSLNHEFSDVLNYGLAFAFKQNKKWGVLNSQGNVIINAEFDGINYLGNDFYSVLKNNKWGVIDKHKKEILDYKYLDVKWIKGKNEIQFLATIEGTKSEILDIDGNVISAHQDAVLINNYGNPFILKNLRPVPLGTEVNPESYILNTNWKNLGVKGELRTTQVPSQLPDKYSFKEVFKDFIGQQKAKDELEKMASTVFVNDMRRKHGQTPSTINFNAAFLGSPGTGKTSFAILMAEQIKKMGLLRKGHFVQVQASDLIAGYQGQTAIQTKEKFTEALGGILFIDEAYNLHSGDGNSYGKECIATLIKLMEDHKGDIIIILAGYEQEIRDLISVNPGFESRIPNMIHFEDYSKEELKIIMQSMFSKEELKPSDELLEYGLEQVLQLRRGKNFGNARVVRNLCERVRTQQNNRLRKEAVSRTISKDDLKQLVYSDFTPENEESVILNVPELPKFELKDSLVEFIGLKQVKDKLYEISLTLEAYRIKGLSLDHTNFLNFLFMGNPGTGKTTVATQIGKILKKNGLLSHGTVLNVDRSSLVAGFQGQTAEKTRKALEKSLGGVFFLDEAYSLIQSEQDQYGFEAMETILKFMEDNKGKMSVIFAGYPKDMEQLIERNSGLRSRFDQVFIFEDLNLEEMSTLLKKELDKLKCASSPEAEKALPLFFTGLKARSGFANARTILKTALHLHSAAAIRTVPTGIIYGGGPTVITVEDLRKVCPEAFTG